MKRIVLLMSMLFVSGGVHAHCGGAFCAMNTNWDVQGVWEKPGVRLDLRAEFIDLDQLRRGSDKTVPGGVVDTHDETRTINRNFTGTLDWSFSPEWGVTLRAPLVNRTHNHVHNEDDGVGGVGPEPESWNFTELGDMQVVGRYAFFQDGNAAVGVRFGLKLPSGSKTEKNGAGEKAERSLQPGTGSTDGILGLYYNRRVGNFTWFGQVSWQQVIHEHDHFRPGRQLGLDVGMNYLLTPDWSLMIQANVQHKSRDSGANAEPDDSGATHLFLSPGISYRATHEVQIYGFLQQPIYQHVRGAQLTADWAAALGVSVQF